MNTYSFKVTCLFMVDWPALSPVLFNNEQAAFSQTESNVGLFVFDHDVTPANLGPLVIVERTNQTELFN
jgi:hypothetical protein